MLTIIGAPFKKILALCSLSIVTISLFLISSSTVLANTSTTSFDSTSKLKSWVQQGEIQCLQPPSNIDLTTLSDEQLASYGLPIHASINANPSFWQSNLTVSRVRHRTCGTSPSKVKKVHHQQPINCSIGMSSSPNWAGNLAHASRGTYKGTAIAFKVPSIDTSNHDAHVSIWAGVGGDADYDVGGSGAVVVQAGVDVSVNIFGGQYNESWWEVYPGVTEQNLPLERLNVGDDINASAESNIQNSGTNYFYIANSSDGYYDYNSHYDYSHFSDSATGECIVEKVGNSSGGLYPLARFWESGQPANTVRIDYCEVEDNNRNNSPIGNLPHFYMQVYDGGTQLASVGPISSNGLAYSVTWHHS